MSKLKFKDVAKYAPYNVRVFNTYSNFLLGHITAIGQNMDFSYYDKSAEDNHRDAHFSHYEKSPPAYLLGLKPLSNLINDGVVVKEMAIIAGCHFKEKMKVKESKLIDEGGVTAIQIHWNDPTEDYFEISFDNGEIELDVDERNTGISFSLGECYAIHNCESVIEVLYKNLYDVKGLIQQGLAIDITTLKPNQIVE